MQKDIDKIYDKVIKENEKVEQNQVEYSVENVKDYLDFLKSDEKMYKLLWSD